MTPRLASAVALCLAAVTGEIQGQAAPETFVRQEPARARDSLATALRGALEDHTDGRADRDALVLARAFSVVWADPFLERRTRWVLSLNTADRARFLEADSLRGVGNQQLFREGPAAARATWRRAGLRFAEIGDSVGMTRILGNIGAAFYEQGQLDSATAFLERAGRAAERSGDRRTAGNAFTILGNVDWERGDLRAAIEHNLHAAELHRASADFGGMAADHNNAGLIAEQLGDLESAQHHYETALETSERHVHGARAADYLVNLGGLADRRGELEVARERFLRALDLYRAAGESANEALVHRNLGMLTASVSAYDEAINEYRRAIALLRRIGDVHGEVEVRRLLASLYAGMGRPDEAIEEIGLAETRLASSPPDVALAAALSVVRGDVELMLNRHEEAAASYLDADRRYRSIGDVHGLSATALGQAQLELRRTRYSEVVRLLEPVASIQHEGRDRAWTQLLLGVARAELGDSGSARWSLVAARSEFDDAGDRAGASLALASLARLQTQNRRPAAALGLFREAEERASGLPAVAWWLHLGLGQTYEAVGDPQRAAVHYDSAVTIVESLADWVRFDDRRAMYLEDKWEAYAAVARLQAHLGNPSAALAASERLRARFLLDLLARHRSVAVREGAVRARERQLSTRIGELTAQFLLADDDGRRGPVSAAADEVREELLVTQGAYRRLLDRMRAEEPDYVRSLRGETVSIDAIRDALRTDELFIEYLLADDQLWIFAVTDTGITQLSVAVGRATLRTQIDFARWAIEKRPAEEALWRGALRELDKVLLDPVRRAGLLDGRSAVIIAPHLELHYLPFEALIDQRPDGDHYFVETHDVVYVPSGSVWLRLRDRPSSEASAVLALAPIDTRLEGTAREVDAIRQVWGPEATVRRGAQATEASLLRSDVPHRIVHLATRGVLNRHNPLFSYVDLAAGDEMDGRLEVHEVFRLALDTDLLVLSACQTGLGSGSVADVPNGDDWVGLVRAFMHAGARNVLATLWAVDDARTSSLTEAFHRRVAAGTSYAHALAEVKRHAIRRTDSGNPYYWAGLVLTGTP